MKRFAVVLLGLLSLLFVSCQNISIEDSQKYISLIINSNIENDSTFLYILNGDYSFTENNEFNLESYTYIKDNSSKELKDLKNWDHTYLLPQDSYSVTLLLLTKHDDNTTSYLSSRNIKFNNDFKVYIVKDGSILVTGDL